MRIAELKAGHSQSLTVRPEPFDCAHHERLNLKLSRIKLVAHKTQNGQARECYRKVWTGANQALQAHPFTAVLPDSEIQRWLTWAEWMVSGGAKIF